jgi:copper chaperone CopZ
MKGNRKLAVVASVLALAAVISISLVAAKNSGTENRKDLLATTLEVSRLSCGSCLATIEAELRKFDGMVEMQGDLFKGQVVVGHTPELTPEKIAAVITDLGYPAKVLESRAASAAGAVFQPGTGGGAGCQGCGPRGCALPVPPPAPEKG